MGFIKITNELLNTVFTENGDTAYRTTGSYCLDFFALVGGMRDNLDDVTTLFMKAYNENPLLAVKILFYTRNIRGGLGERNIFRYLFNLLCSTNEDVARQLLKYIPFYGRFDDVFAAFDTPIRKDLMSLIRNQLLKDIKLKEEGKDISLLAKWMPSINTSNDEVRALAVRVSQSLGFTKEQYRKMLSFLRKDLIIENNLRVNDYTFNYQAVPGGAMMKYQKAFLRNDEFKFKQYLEDVNNKKVKINSKTIYPYEVIRKLEKNKLECKSFTDDELKSLDTIWNSFKDNDIDSRTIVVRDGSGSMYNTEGSVKPSSIATSLTILFAEKLKGEFHNKFITFSSTPSLVDIVDGTIFDKFNQLFEYDDYSTTNINSVYQLILNVYKHQDFKKEDAIDRIVIVSDMEFDSLNSSDISTYENFKNSFLELGYKLPEVVFWNVAARSIHLPVTLKDTNVKLVSGAAPILMEMVCSNNDHSAYDFMIKTLEQYKELDHIKF